MARKITLALFFIILAAINSPAEAKVRSAGLSPRVARTLDQSLQNAAEDIERVVQAEPAIPEPVKLSCSRKYNESIDGLTDSLAQLNRTANPPENVTAYIEDWVNEAEKNETDCLTAGLTSHASTTMLAAFSYVICALLFFSFVSVVSPLS